jgi:CRP/FNR family transcriptional regulator, transcriptional activator FtrB
MPSSVMISPPATDQSDVQTVDQALRSVPLLENVEDRVVDRLVAISSIVNAAEGTELCRQRQPADQLYIVLEGQLTGVNTAPNGTTAVVEVIRAGGTLGLSTVLARLPRLVSVQTITPSRLLAIDAEGLLALVAEETSLVTALLRAEAREFRAMVRQVCDLKLRTTAQRLGCYLLSLSNEQLANTATLRLPFDKRLLAARLGCRQENLSRAFAALRGFGVETHGARVILHDIAKLRDYSVPDEPYDEAFA